MRIQVSFLARIRLGWPVLIYCIAPSSVDTTAESSRRSSYEARCPARLMSMCPPSNYGTVLDGQLYRSSFPNEDNFGFLKTLKLKSIL